MNYIVDGQTIAIPTEKRPFGFGSEGKVYKIGTSLYKIYDPNALNEGFGNKFRHHQYFLRINPL